VVEPGYVETEMSESFYRTAGARRKIRAEVPLGRIGKTEEIAALVAFLAGPEAGYVTRERIAVSGGR
jgi:NAD(P)-dependent dehydrogenase (short-subunit alcohol dehydrogenase family)